MTVVFIKGDEFWIEYLQITVIMEDAAGRYSSATTNLSKGGVFLGGNAIARALINNDNSQGMGGIELKLDSSGTNLTLGTFASTIAIRVNKVAGTAGSTNINFHVMVLMRGRGLHS